MDRASRRRLERERGDLQGFMLAYLHPGHVDGQFCDSMVNTLLWDANNGQRISKWGGVIAMETSPRIAAARNDVCWQFLDYRERVKDRGGPAPEWLVFIDSDMKWTAADFEKLAEVCEDGNEHRIVGGLCFAGGRSSAVFPTLYVLEDVETMRMEKAVDYPDDTLVKVSATGAAFLAIHISVIETMKVQYATVNGKKNPMIWFRDGTADGKEFGEDIWFCMAANGAGFPTYVHTGIKIGHMKRFDLNEQYWRDSLESDN